jgi:hypothetical protein
VISTPNRDVYRRIAPHNPFHCSELGASEFAALLETSFSPVRYYAQRLLTAPWWDLRGAAADSWPARRIWGVGRLTHLLRGLGRVPSTTDLPEGFRRDFVAAILAKPRRIVSWLVDPYAIRRRDAAHVGESVYTIAVGCRR